MPSKKPRPRPSVASLRRAFEDIVWPRRKLVLVGLLLILVNRLSGLVLPASTKYLVDDVIQEGQGELLWTLLGAVALAIGVQAATSFALTRLLSVEAQLLIAGLRSQVQYHVLRLPVRSFDDTRSGELVSRVMDDVEGVRNLVGTGLVQLVGGTLTAVVAMVFLVNIDPVMTALALVPLGLFRTHPGFGQRLGAAIGFAWMVVIAVGILRDREPSPETPGPSDGVRSLDGDAYDARAVAGSVLRKT